MKITVYTITDCQFSKEEKEYLASHQLQYEEKNLETNKDWLTEMLTLSNNFAGTPVTKVEKDDGNIVVLKGFTKEEFDTTLGFTPPPANTQTPAPVTDTTTPPPAQTQPTDPLASVLDDLQTKVDSTEQPPTQPPTEPTPPPAETTAPAVQTPPPATPSVPDFNSNQ